MNGDATKPPADGQPGDSRGQRPTSRRGRFLGLLAALGFSLAIWAFLAMAVLGLILKVIG